MLYHITYRKYDGSVEVYRCHAKDRNGAIRTAASMLMLPQSRILSAVGCPQRRAV